MPAYLCVKDVAAGELPLAVAFAQEASLEELVDGTPYNTYTTASGVNQNLDDAPLKDEE